MANNENRTGLIPVETVEKFEIDTAKVTEYLQKRLNVFTSKARENGVDTPDIPINVLSLQLSDKFVPFIAILSEDSIHNKSDNSDKEIMSIFKNKDNTRVDKLDGTAWAALKSFMYTKKDKTAFTDSPNVRKMLSLSTNAAAKAASLCSPRIMNINKDTKNVVFLLDPIRVFSDMIGKHPYDYNKDNNAPKFFTHIEKSVKITHANFKYTVTKVPKKRNGGDGANVDVLKYIQDYVKDRNR